MKNPLALRAIAGFGSAALLTATLLTLGTASASADPISELLCSTGSAECEPSKPAPDPSKDNDAPSPAEFPNNDAPSPAEFPSGTPAAPSPAQFPGLF